MREFVIKLLILLGLIILYNAIFQTISPTFANQLALQQMQNYDTSSVGIQVYQYLTNYSWVLFVIVSVGMFKKNIANMIKRIKERMSNEEE